MRRFLGRAALLVTPLLVLGAVQLALPLDAFCFRTWEGVAVLYRTHDVVGLGPLHMPRVTALPGPFLPNVRVERIEEGDLGHHTSHAVPRRVVWETDAHGYRAAPVPGAPELVLVGDSNVVGTGLTQADTLAHVLRREHGLAAYPYAPAEVEAFAADPRFVASPARQVVLVFTERNVLSTFAAVRAATPRPRAVESSVLAAADVAVNRLYAFPLLEWLRASVNGRREPVEAGGLLFLQGARANALPDAGRVRAAAETLASWARRLESRGTRLAVLVVPNKENTYADLLPGGGRAALIPAIRDALRARGVDAIDVEADFSAARAAGQAPFQADDTHWSAVGVRIAAARVALWASTSGAAAPRVAAP